MARRKDSESRGMSVSYDVGELMGTSRRRHEDRGGETVRKNIESGFKRTTVIVNEDRFHYLTAWAAMQGETIKDVLDEAIADYIRTHIPDYAQEAIEKAKRG